MRQRSQLNSPLSTPDLEWFESGSKQVSFASSGRMLGHSGKAAPSDSSKIIGVKPPYVASAPRHGDRSAHSPCGTLCDRRARLGVASRLIGTNPVEALYNEYVHVEIHNRLDHASMMGGVSGCHRAGATRQPLI